MAANSGWQLVGFAARAISGLGVVVLVARSGGPRSLGIFQFALTLTAMLPFFFGIPSLLAREVARRPADGRKWVEAGTLISLAFGGFFTLLFGVGAVVVDASPETILAVPLAGVGMAFDGVARVQFAAFWAWERMNLEALVTVVQEAVFLLATVIVLEMGGGVEGALFAFSGSRALGAGLGWMLVGRHLGGPTVPRGERQFLRTTLRRCTPFAVNDTLTLTYMRVDSVMLGMFKGPVAVGLYQAGTNLVLYLNVLARCINHALYPRMSKAWPDRLGDFRRLRDASYRAIGLIAMPAAVGCLLLAGRTFHLLYGSRFNRAIVTYQLLVLVIPVRMLGNTLSLSLSAANLQTRRTVAVTMAAALNVGLNLYFIPRWSYLGAAVTTVVCESSLLLTYAFYLHRVAGSSDLLRSVSLPGAATIPMALAILATRDQHLLVSAFAGVAVYGMALVAIALVQDRGSIRQQPVRALVNLVRPA